MVPRSLGRCGLRVSPVGFGAFKIGRNEGVKYAQAYELPDDAASDRLLREVLDLGITYIDTAPAYGLSEERVGRVAGRLPGIVISTKVGETFENGRSTYDFSAAAVRASVDRSMKRLRRDVLDVVFVHAPTGDLEALNASQVVETLLELRCRGRVAAIGLSGKTVAAAEQSLQWADVLMVEYHPRDRSHEAVMRRAAAAGVGVIVKKGLASGAIPASEAVPFILREPCVSSLVVGSLRVDHLREIVQYAVAAAPP